VKSADTARRGKKIILKPVKVTETLFEGFEKKKLIKLLRPSKAAIETRTKTGTVSRFYTSKKEFGAHTLMCVGKRTAEIRLSYHEDNEDFMLLNPLGLKFKRLYLIISFLKKNDFLRKFNAGKLAEKDLTAVELEFNNPKLSFFTMLKHTVHCEVADRSEEQHPVFFVSEPSELKDNKLSTKLYDIRINDETGR